MKGILLMCTRGQREAELEELSVTEIAAEYAKAMATTLGPRSPSNPEPKVGQMIREILEREFPLNGNRPRTPSGSILKSA
jgi:hypothetical protein